MLKTLRTPWQHPGNHTEHLYGNGLKPNQNNYSEHFNNYIPTC